MPARCTPKKSRKKMWAMSHVSGTMSARSSYYITAKCLDVVVIKAVLGTTVRNMSIILFDLQHLGFLTANR